MSRRAGRRIKLSSGRTLKTTPVYDSYWRFASERQKVFMQRVRGAPPPWTDDHILAQHRFTNAYRASDRVSQYLIAQVIYRGDQKAEEVFFRTLLFKLFNKIETWEALERELGETPSWRRFAKRQEDYAAALDALQEKGEKLYSAAYIMPAPRLGAPDPRKHRKHLELLRHMMDDGAADRFRGANSLEGAYEALLGYPSLGPFLAFQYAIDLNYSAIADFSEMDFVVAGPGALRGIAKCFSDTGGLTPAEVIRAMAELAKGGGEFKRLELAFDDLWGRPLQLVDCQNLFCETDKYARIAHPDIRAKGEKPGSRIKQKYRPPAAQEGQELAGKERQNGEKGAAGAEMPQFYPPKWGLDIPADTAPAR